MSNLVLHNGHYFDTDTKEMVKFQRLHIRDGRIHTIDGDDVEGVKTIDCTGKFVIPGLIDGHIHFFQSAGLYTRPDGLDLRHIRSYEDEVGQIKDNLREVFKRYLACGVTGVIDNGGPMWNAEVKRQAEEAGDVAPHVAWAGPLVSTVSREKLDIGDPPIIKADNEEHARLLVRNCVDANPDFVKFWFIYQPERFDVDSAIMQAGIEEAKRLEKRVMVHATELETAKRAVKYGANILVHSVFDSDIDQEFISMVLDKEVVYIPTIMVRKGYQQVFRTRLEVSEFEERWGDPAAFSSFRDLMLLEEEQVPEDYRDFRRQWQGPLEDLEEFARPNLRRLYRAGATIVTGTDAGNIGTLHGPSLHYEMEVMVKAGMKPEDVLLSTTKHAANLLQANAGEIKPGKLADLVILDADPLEQITATRQIHRVIRAGNLYFPTELVNPVSFSDPVQRQVEAYNARDIDAFLVNYHPRVELYDLNSGQMLMKGIDAMRPRFQQLFDVSPNLNSEVTHRIIQGRIVIDHETVTGFRGDNTSFVVAIHEVKNQVITKVWFVR